MFIEKAHDGVMVVFYLPPDIASQVALPNGLEPDDLHLTLAYLGGKYMMDTSSRDSLENYLRTWSMYKRPITGKTNGIGLFSTNQGDGSYPLYANFDSAELPAFRQGLVNYLQVGGFPTVREHGFTPHITLKYQKNRLMPVRAVEPVEITFSAITLKWGDWKRDLPLWTLFTKYPWTRTPPRNP